MTLVRRGMCIVASKLDNPEVSWRSLGFDPVLGIVVRSALIGLAVKKGLGAAAAE